jgi:hypothetical protein
MLYDRRAELAASGDARNGAVVRIGRDTELRRRSTPPCARCSRRR